MGDAWECVGSVADAKGSGVGHGGGTPPAPFERRTAPSFPPLWAVRLFLQRKGNLVDLTDVYQDTRDAAGEVGTWRVRWRAHQARRALSGDQNNQRLQVEQVALQHELTARGVGGREPRPDEPFHRLA